MLQSFVRSDLWSHTCNCVFLSRLYYSSFYFLNSFFDLTINFKGFSWSWSYGSWLYNYLCNQYLSPLTLWVQIPLSRGVQRYVIKFVSDMRQVDGFHRVVWFPRPIKLTAKIYIEILYFTFIFSLFVFVSEPVNITVYWPDPVNIMFSSGFCPNSFLALDIQ
jgi:hypothetical protein